MIEETCNGYFAEVAAVLIHAEYVKQMPPKKYCATIPKKLNPLERWMRRGNVCQDCYQRFVGWQMRFIVDAVAATADSCNQFPSRQDHGLIRRLIDVLLDELAESDQCFAQSYGLLLR